MNSCIENLDKCNASCCRVLTFTLNLSVGHPLETYYRSRGLKVIRKDRFVCIVIVPHRCNNLAANNLCTLHDTGKKPKLCSSLNKKNCNDSLYYITDGCIYGD